MSWNDLDEDFRHLAERLCTEKEIVALKLWENGAGYRRVGHILGISMSTARGRIHRALDRIRNEQEAHAQRTEEPMGNPDPLRQQNQQSAEVA